MDRPERIKQCFTEYTESEFKGKLVNRLDLHEQTFGAGYNQGREDKRYEASKEIKPLLEKLQEFELLLDFDDSRVIARQPETDYEKGLYSCALKYVRRIKELEAKLDGIGKSAP